jgi:aryl-alcohol dehydrogenase-like predicted oxidoreductase
MAARHPWKQGDNFRTNLELVEWVREIADEKGLTPSKLAIAWVLSRGEDIVSIFGTRSRKCLEEKSG